MAGDTPWKEAILEVLSSATEPMSTSGIADAIVSASMRENYGSTPANTVSRFITTSINEEGDSSPYFRVSYGRYLLRTDVVGQSQREPVSNLGATGGIQAFGVYWDRNRVNWSGNVLLLGQQQVGTQPVDFSGQIGIYLLYDGREVVYVGRSTDGTIGNRLFKHTQARLRARWDRFSWFGLYPVTDDGKLERSIIDLSPEVLIRTLEAVCIESLEPRQNRKRGDDFDGLEFFQSDDPEIERKEKLALLAEMKKSI